MSLLCRTGAVERQFISWVWVNIHSDPLKVNNCQVSHRTELQDICALRLALRLSDVLMARSSVPPQAARLRRPGRGSPEPTLHHRQQRRKIRSDKCPRDKTGWGFR